MASIVILIFIDKLRKKKGRRS